MLSELQRTNIGTVFDALDHDRSGVITRVDFEGLAHRLAYLLGHPPGTDEARSLFVGYVGWWEQIRGQADADADGKVTREEYVAAVGQGLLEDPHYLDAVATAAGNLFAAADKDGDGMLDQSEVVVLYGVVGIAEEVAAGAFRSVDLDGDGRISRDEWLAAVRGAFASKGPEEMGAHLFGN